ncbi:MAG: hypothetical protein HC828_02280 [Blastochloris sp.]|nr:hypothetical protein [Blastochloris sp.]
MRTFVWTTRLRRWCDRWLWYLVGTPTRVQQTRVLVRLLVIVSGIALVATPPVTFAQAILPDLSFIGDLADDLRNLAIAIALVMYIWGTYQEWTNNPDRFGWGTAVWRLVTAAIIVALIWGAEAMLTEVAGNGAGGGDDNPNPPNPGTP